MLVVAEKRGEDSPQRHRVRKGGADWGTWQTSKHPPIAAPPFGDFRGHRAPARSSKSLQGPFCFWSANDSP